MGNCKYELDINGDILRFSSERELTDFVISNKVAGKNSIKFSTNLTERQSAITKAISGAFDATKYGNKELLQVSDFLAKKHDLGKGEVYLTPYFDTELYIKNKVAEEKKLKNFDEDQEELYKNELIEELEEDDRMSKNGMALHALIKSAVQFSDSADYFKKINPLIESFIQSVESFNSKEIGETFKYDSDLRELIKKNILSEINRFLKFTYNISENSLTGVKLLNETAGVKDSSDIILIDSMGNPHILDISLSRKSYLNWDTAKVSAADYKLGIQRQMLESIVPTKNSSLYTVPFLIPVSDGLLDLSNFSLNNISQRDSNPRLLPEGEISRQLRKLIPSKFTNFHILQDETNAANEQLLSAIFPTNYISRSKWAIENKETLIKNIIEKKAKDNADNFILYDRLEGKPITIEEESKIESIVDDYIKRYNDNKHSEVHRLRRTIQNAMLNPKDGIRFGKDSTSVILNTNLEKYLNGDWELLENNIYLNQDLLVFRNNHYKTIEVISITTNTLDAIYPFGLGNTLLGKFRTNIEANKDKRILPASTINVEIVKALAILNNTPELFENYTLGKIKVLNYSDGRSGEGNMDELIYNFTQLHKIANRNKDLTSIDNFGTIIKRPDKIEELYQEVLFKLSTSQNSNLRDIAKGSRIDIIEDKLNWFYTLQDTLRKVEPSLQETPEKILDYKNDSIAYIDWLVAQAIVYYNSMKFSFDYHQPRIGLTIGDAGHMLQTWYYGEGAEYDSKGNKIVGLLGGSLFNTTDSMASRDITKIHDLISLAQSHIRQIYAPHANQYTAWTKQYYEDCGRGNLSKYVIGDADPYHKVFYKLNPKTGNIADGFSVKNPHDLNENLKDHERLYLKRILWELYKDKVKLPEDHQKLNIEQVEKLPEFKDYLKDSKYFQIPLKKKQDITKWKSLTTEDFWKSVGKRWEEIKDNLDPRNITDIHRKDAKNRETTVYRMWNEFNIGEKRDELIHEYRPEYFEINLDTILLEHRFAAIRENTMNHTLKIVNAAAVMLKYNAYQSGKADESTEAFKDLFKQIRISAYGTTTIEGEMAQPIAIIKQAQKIASIMFITLRPVLTLKELITGTIKNVSFAYTKIWGDDSFEEIHLAKAYQKVMFNKDQTLKDFNLIDNLNMIYGIANIDSNKVVQKSKVDRFGLFKFFSEHLYWFNNAGDYVNRLTLFTAMMIKDGSFDAHVVNSEGILKYDPKLDDRFKIYFAKRDKYNYKFVTGDKEYNDQRSLYLAMLDDFNVENEQTNSPKLDERKDIIPRAYTHKQRESIKVFADTAYGFYDHERTHLLKNTAVGSIFGQFLTFWPSKVKFYFGKEMESKYGNYKQEFELDANGEKQLVWLKEVYSEDGELIGTEKTFENTGIISKTFITDPFEGLFYSLGLTIRDITKGNFDLTPLQRKRRAALAMHDLIMGLIIGAIIAAMMQDFKEDPETSDGKMIVTKAFNKALGEFNPILLFSSLSWEPAFVGMLGNVQDMFMSLFDGNSDTEKMFRKGFKAMELIPRITE